MTKPVCLILGAGAGIGGNVAKRFAGDAYAAMGERRMLCQSLNAQFADKGIHVAHVVIDGAVDAPDTPTSRGGTTPAMPT